MIAYQLIPGGAPARLRMFRGMALASQNNRNESTRLAPGDWKGARHYRLDTAAAAYGALAQGQNIWCTSGYVVGRNERDADDIISRLPRGWFTDPHCDDTAVGIVSGLSHGRFIAGYRWTSNDERVYLPGIFTDENDAARMADEHARVFAESAREDSERFDAMSKAEIDVETAVIELQKSIKLRRYPQFGGRDSVRGHIEALREARETLARATREYENGDH